MKKKKQKRSKVKEFLRGINGVNIMKGSNHYAAYCKVPFKRNYIHNIKELPCSKNTIKLALKRLIIIGFLKQDHDWYYVNQSNMEKMFIKLSQFQDIKTQPIRKIKNKKIISTYKKEAFLFKDFVKFFRNFYFKKRLLSTRWIDRKNTFGKSQTEYRILKLEKMKKAIDKY